MGFTNFYLTNKGANLLAKSQAGVVINFTKVGIGKGDLPQGTSITSVTALFNKVKDLPISGVSAGNGQAQIGFQFINTGITSSFLWKELGLYATDPDEGEILYAYGYTTEPDPIPVESQLIEFLFNMIVKISNTTQITATIDNSLIFATKDVATNTSNGLMTKEDKSKLDGIAANANNYTHPTGDGNQHIPATGTTNNGKVLKAGATAGSAAWGNVTADEVGAYSKTEVDEKESALNLAIGQITLQKSENKVTVFNANGSITETIKNGATTLRTKTTTFPSATQIVETTVENGVTTTKTTTFNADGTIKEEVV